MITLCSCRTKKTFNGTSQLDCPDLNGEKINQKKELKKKSKWRLVLYKDGENIAKSKKRGKSKLFKN